jgi:predicted permease
MLTDLFHRLRALVARRTVENELDEELRFHFDRLVDSYKNTGVSPADALRRARLEFGGLDQVKEEYRDALGTRLVEECWRDLRHAIRSLAANPLVSIVVVISLALGIGANAAIFSLVNALLLRPLPVQQPERLAVLGDTAVEGRSWSNPVWEQIRARASLFDGALAWSPQQFNLARGGEAQLVEGVFASGEFFEVLGVRAAVGRTFTAVDDRRRGGPDGPVAVIGDAFWKRRFAGAQDVIGRPLTLGSVTFTIIGVMPPSFFGPDVGRRFDVVLPIGTEPLLLGANSSLNVVGRNWLRIMLRLKAGQSVEEASGLLRGIQEQIRTATIGEIPDLMRPRYLAAPLMLTSASTGRSPLRNQYGRPLVALAIIVGAVLLVACLNIVNLLLARASARRHEMSLRTSLGASRIQLARLVFLEAAVLTGVGALVGASLSRWMSQMLVQQLSTQRNVVFLDLAFDSRGVGFAFAIAVATAVLIGVVPAWQSTRSKPGDFLRARSRGSDLQGRSPIAAALVVSQVAISLVLVVAAALFVRTFANLLYRDMGFTKDHIVVVNVTAPMTKYTLQRLTAVYDRIREAVAALPGVQGAVLSDITPAGGSARETLVDIPGAALPEAERAVSVNVVSPGWFAAYGTRLLSGRDIAVTDRLTTPVVALVNQTFARKFFGSGDAIGRTIAAGTPGRMTNFEIVGVVEDAVYRFLRDPVPPTIYTATTQRSAARPYVNVSVSMPAGLSAATTQAIAEAIRQIDPDLVLQFMPLGEQVDSALNQERLLALLSGFLGILALMLAALGLYGLTAYAVGRRRGEIGIRMALGARAASVVWLFVRRTAVLVALGLAVGIMLSFWASQFIAALMWGLQPRDTLTLLGAAGLLAAVGVLAAWVPARRAARIDPVAVLRAS